MNSNINITMQMQTPQVAPGQRFFHTPKFQATNFQKPNFQFAAHNRQHLQPQQNIEFDGKRLRKAVTRKTVDYNSSVLKYLESRVWQRDYRDRRVMQPDSAYYIEMMPPLSMPDNPINAVTTKFVRTSTNKMRCPIFCVAWTPEGRRLVTGASSGEFTLWNGLTFNFETILQAHDSSVRCMVWSHNDIWMVTGDHAGYVKYWQSNMNNVKMFQSHKEPLRGISFCPLDTKFVTCSDDGTVRIWDFLKCFEEKILRGHGADVKCVDWHPQKSLIVSGSKDSQQPIKLWDPKTGQSLATVHAHKNTVMDAKWNKNGNWLLTASRDHLIKLFDIRNMSQEIQTFRGHKKEATTLAWHPTHEGLFASGGSDGSVMFWVAGADKEVGCMEQAHDSCVWSLAWHPLGHILCSGSNDHSSKFWTRNRPGDRMRDKYNLNTLPKGQEDAADYDDSGTITSSIPGMGLEYGLPDHLKQQENSYDEEITIIPGLDFSTDDAANEKSQQQKKIPFSKPIPKQFQQQWMDSKQPLLLAPPQEDRNSEQNQNTSQQSQEHYNAPPADMKYQDHQENYHEPKTTEASSQDTWRTYSDTKRDSEQDRNVNENGSHLHNPELRGNFEHPNNVGPPSNRGQYQNAMPEDKFPPNSGPPPRGPPPQNFYGSDKDMRFQGGNMDGPPRNSHIEENYGPHKRSWHNESHGNENHFSMDHKMQNEYMGGPPPMDYGPPRHHMRPPGGPMYFGGRGPRGGPYRGPRSPYRIVNRGRGVRSGYPE